MKILITREERQGVETAKILEKEGFEPVLFPTIRFEPIPFDIKKVYEAEVIIFSSQNGVVMFFEKVKPEILKGKTIIATGEKTKKSLEKTGIKDVILPETYTSKGVGQMLLQNSSFKGKKAVIVRPLEGIDDAKKILNGYMEVQTLPVYKTVENLPPYRDRIKKMLERGAVEYVLFTSPSTFKGFKKNFPEDWKRLLEKTKIAVIGTTTQKTIEKEGLKIHVVPEKFTLEGVIHSIKQQVS